MKLQHFGFFFMFLILKSKCNFDSDTKFFIDLIKLTFVNISCLYIIENETKTKYTTIFPKSFQNYQIVSVTSEKIQVLQNLEYSCDGYIILCNNATLVNHLFSTKAINLYFKPHKQVLLFMENMTNINKTELTAASELHDLHLLLVESVANNTREHNLFSYNKNNFRVTSLHYNKVVNDGFYIQAKFLTRPWLPKSVLDKFNRSFSVVLFNCPPYVVFNERKNRFDGIDIRILNQTLKDWPIHYKFLTTSKDNSEHLYRKAFQQVVDNERDIAVCSQWQQVAYQYNVAKSIEYTRTCRTLLIHRPKLLPNYSFIFQSLQLDLWLLYVLVILFFSIIMFAISNTCDKFYNSRSFLNSDIFLAFTYTLRICSLGSIDRILSTIQFSLRILLTAMSTFFLLISVYYCAGLTISLRFPRFSKNINTLQDIVDNRIKWLDPDNYLKNWMQNTSSELFHQLAEQFEMQTTITESNRKLHSRKYALMVQVPPTGGASYVMFSETLDDHGRRHLKLLSEKIVCFYSLFPMKTNSPYLDIFNKSILSLIEYGFIKHWYKSLVNKRKFRFMKKFFQRYSQEVFQIINLEKLQGIFYVLALGQGLAILVF